MPHDDLVLRRTIRHIGLLDRTAVFDHADQLHERIETTFASPVGGDSQSARDLIQAQAAPAGMPAPGLKTTGRPGS